MKPPPRINSPDIAARRGPHWSTGPADERQQQYGRQMGANQAQRQETEGGGTATPKVGQRDA